MILEQDWQMFSAKSQLVNILHCAGRIVSVTMPLLDGAKVAVDYM